jgi:hypothetical protein
MISFKSAAQSACAVGLCLKCQIYGIFLTAIYLYHGRRIPGCIYIYAVFIGFNTSLLPFLNGLLCENFAYFTWPVHILIFRKRKLYTLLPFIDK